MNNGWIKISKSIAKHWIWQDAERLKWWLDLVIMANWDDNKVVHRGKLKLVKRGQVVASAGFLAKRWGRNWKTVDDFLKQLKDDGMIKDSMELENADKTFRVLTICNYDKYQTSMANAAENVTEMPTENITENVLQKATENVAEINKEYKEKKEYKEISHQHACARENDFFADLKANKYWQETALRMKFHLSEAECLKWIADFELECNCKMIKHNSLADTSRHFTDWLRIQLKMKNMEIYERTDKSGRRPSEARINPVESYREQI